MSNPKCIGCGYCCTMPCSIAHRIHGKALQYCPELRWDGDRHICRLMTLQGDQGAGYRKELFAGAGCCSNLNSWRREPLQDRTHNETKEFIEIPAMMQLFLKSLGGLFISGDALWLALNNFKRNLIKEGMDKDKATRIEKLARSYILNNRTKQEVEMSGQLGKIAV